MKQVTEAVIEMRGITKSFNGFVANKNIDFNIKKGEIHALIGENGAGKTTLMKILSGMYQPTEGDIYVHQQKVKIKSPGEALNLGIGMVYQHSTLVPTFSILENVLLGTTNKLHFSIKYASPRINEIAKSLEMPVESNLKINQLTAGEQKKIEIIKLLYRGLDVLIFDEPTSFFSPSEVDRFFIVLKNILQLGKSVVFITHKIEEALKISNRLSILRQGKKIEEIHLQSVSGINNQEIMKERILKAMFIGANPFVKKRKLPTLNIDRAVLTLKNVKANNDSGEVALRRVSFALKKGEVFGIAGLDGNGQKELAEVITGQRKVESGQITLNEYDITNKAIKYINDKGIFYVTEDRIQEGSVGAFTVADNTIFRCYKMKPFSINGIFLNRKEIKKHADKLIDEFSIQVPNSDALVKMLSGGNIQKLILARELSSNPLIIICNQPTQGLDVMTTRFIRSELNARSSQGVSVILISSDLDELLELSNRIGILYKGELIDILQNFNIEKNTIGKLVLGLKEE